MTVCVLRLIPHLIRVADFTHLLFENSLALSACIYLDLKERFFLLLVIILDGEVFIPFDISVVGGVMFEGLSFLCSHIDDAIAILAVVAVGEFSTDDVESHELIGIGMLLLEMYELIELVLRLLYDGRLFRSISSFTG
jgi:hypothetical protein